MAAANSAGNRAAGSRSGRARTTTLVALLGTIALLGAACTGTPSDSNPIDRASPGELAGGALERFDDCAELQDYATDAVSKRQVAYPEGAEEFADVGAALAGPADASRAPLSDTGDDGAAVEGQDYSGTNVQEEGVDEADLVKTDGEIVVAAVNGTLHVLDGSGEAQLVGDVPLPGPAPHDLFLDGDTVVSVSAAQPVAVPLRDDGDLATLRAVGTPETPSTVVAQIDVSDPTEPIVGEQRSIDGNLVAARSVDGTIRLALSNQPVVVDQLLYSGMGPDAVEDIVENLEPDVWLPTIGEPRDQGDDREPIVSCDAVQHPVDPPGIGMSTITVVTLDADGALDDLTATSVMGDGQTVYASTDNLYVASTTPWADAGSSHTATIIHQFDITGAEPATYLGSGAVQGRLLNQFSMSEHEGVLRVATTEDPRGDAEVITQSSITTLEHSGQELAEIGKVTGLGPNEDIHSVRFIGDKGYVVTFRQTDPLYVVDLADPAAPTVEGELKILGYSAYLHPVGDDLLLGVGQDATEQGVRLGTQVSLFDVSDPTNPTRVQQMTLDGGSSAVEWNHRAFLWWDPAGVAVVPVMDIGADGFVGALALTVSSDGIEESGRVEHPMSERERFQSSSPCPDEADCLEPIGPTVDLASGEILRSFVMNGDELWTVSYSGVKVSDLSGLDDLEWISFHE